MKYEFEFKRCDLHTDEVLEQLRTAEEQGQLEETLVRLCTTKEMDMRTIWECRDYFIARSEDFYREHPDMISIRIVIEAMAGRLENTKELLDKLGTTPEDLTGYIPNGVDLVRMMSEIVMPQISNSEAVKRAHFIAGVLKSPIMGLALTACRPSVINGFRDMTEYCKNMEENEEAICKAIDMIYGRSGKGVYEVALAEWKYETGNAFEALLILASIIPTLEDEKDVRCLFAAYMLQMRILVFGGQTKNNSEIFDKVREKITSNYYDELEASLDAVICLYHCYEADHDYMEDWLANKAPNENKDIFMMDMYAYLVKMRVYLQTDKYMLTTLLAQKMLNYLEQSHRPHDVCECLLLTAMACLKAGDEENAVTNFIKALEIGEKYGYIRVFSDEGQIIVELIKLYRDRLKNDETVRTFDENWLKTIRGYALEVATRYPNYLKTRQDAYAGLTKTEKRIVMFMSMGLTNEDIGNQMNKKEKTIRFHVTNIFKKLKVSNRQQAVNKAKEIGYV